MRASSGCYATVLTGGELHVRPLRSNDSMLLQGSRHFPRTIHTSSIGCQSPTKGGVPAPDGRTELRLSPLELLERLAPLIPPPRMHRHRYHGVLAPNARLRAAVVAIGRPEVVPSATEATGPVPVHDASRDNRGANFARIRWAGRSPRSYRL